ncbi:sialidase family protein [Paraburkholderia sp.]|uniref:sialidase family protein n=1 Tax=Paraburkholderia sp. TaxID=1926495 RepID=UPI00239EF06D|nr:sialidase family protein [Paraburkholderia sp.]MDE1179328.1 sialidase family protein [Paraburkholderia sp.]
MKIALGKLIAGVCLAAIGTTAHAAIPAVDLFPASDSATACYRIPALLTLHDGTMLAFAEARRTSCADFGYVQVVMRRSTDAGVTWSTQQVVASDGTLQAGNPVPVEDTSDPNHPNGRLFLFYNTGNASEASVRAGSGLREQWYTTSEDGGLTWDTPVNISAQTARLSASPYNNAADWRALAMGPGHGVQTTSGRIFVAGNHSVGAAKSDYTDYVAYAFYSDDHGQSFSIVPDIAYPGSNESSAAQLGDGRVMINSRDQTGVSKARVVAITSDVNGTVFGTPHIDTTLIDPVAEGSLLSATVNSQAYLFFLNLANASSRKTLTLRASTDNGTTWTKSLLITANAAGYSDIAVINASTIGILYEQSTIKFMKVPFATLLGTP